MRNITTHGAAAPSRQGSLSAGPLTGEPAACSARLLVSVRNAAESLAAFEGGASFIDIKEPSNGSLGRASRAVQADVVSALGARRAAGGGQRVTVTAALGELLESGPESYRPVGGLSLYKLGLSRCGDRRDWPARLDAWRERLMDGGAELAAVAYADHRTAGAPDPREVLEYAIDRDLPFLLIDTFEKGAGSLRDSIGEQELLRLLGDAHHRGVSVALAGSLRLEDVSRLARLGADVIAVRGAACREGDRRQDLDPHRVRELARLLRASDRPFGGADRPIRRGG